MSDGTGQCSGCPELQLDRYLMAGPGMQLRNVFDLDFALTVRMKVGWDAMNYYEFLLLRILREEKDRLQEEQIRKARAKNG